MANKMNSSAILASLSPQDISFETINDVHMIKYKKAKDKQIRGKLFQSKKTNPLFVFYAFFISNDIDII